MISSSSSWSIKNFDFFFWAKTADLDDDRYMKMESPKKKCQVYCGWIWILFYYGWSEKSKIKIIIKNYLEKKNDYYHYHHHRHHRQHQHRFWKMDFDREGGFSLEKKFVRTVVVVVVVHRDFWLEERLMVGWIFHHFFSSSIFDLATRIYLLMEKQHVILLWCKFFNFFKKKIIILSCVLHTQFNQNMGIFSFFPWLTGKIFFFLEDFFLSWLIIIVVKHTTLAYDDDHHDFDYRSYQKSWWWWWWYRFWSKLKKKENLIDSHTTKHQSDDDDVWDFKILKF